MLGGMKRNFESLLNCGNDKRHRSFPFKAIAVVWLWPIGVAQKPGRTGMEKNADAGVGWQKRT